MKKIALLFWLLALNVPYVLGMLALFIEPSFSLPRKIALSAVLTLGYLVPLACFIAFVSQDAV